MTFKSSKLVLRTWCAITTLAFLSACQGEPVEEERGGTEESTAVQKVELGFYHPLSGMLDEHGKVYVYERKNSERGQRYALQESLYEHEDEDSVTQSGVIELDVRRMTKEEHHQDAKSKETLTPDKPMPKVHQSLQSFVQKLDPQERVPVTLWLEHKEEHSISHEMELLIGRGKVTTAEGYKEHRENVVANRAQKIEISQEKIMDALQEHDAEVTWRYRNIPALEISVPAGALESLGEQKPILSIDLLPSSQDEHVTGMEVIDGTQSTQFIDDGYDGVLNSPLYFAQWAVIELGGARTIHRAFDSTRFGGSRILGRLDCSGSGNSATCSSGTWTNYGNHATGVTAIVAGDLRDGQDGLVTSTTARVQRSGISGESRGLVYRANYGNGRYDRVMAAYDDIISKGNVLVTNQSNGTPWNVSYADDPNCTGRTNFTRTVNAVHEAGILPVISAGNTGTNGTNCTINSPATALGAMSVGSHGSGSSTTEADVRTGGISGFSSTSGGVARDIVDVAAHGCRRLLPSSSGTYSYSGCGTSFAAPTVVGNTLNFVTFYKDTFSDFVLNNPGALMSNLLLMGDRQGTSSVLSSGFDDRWGAGRLKMRKWDTEGMDNPAKWGTGSVCVDNGEVITIKMNGGNQLDSRVDYLKAVIYWYDNRHDNSTASTMDDIDLKIVRADNGATVSSSLSGANNKERVFAQGVGGDALSLEIRGFRVTSDNSGCGPNSMKVYYSWLWEDNARNDSTLPNIDPEL